MSETKYYVSDEAYVKILLHGSKYPANAINGILVGTEEGQGYRVHDAMPLFHQAVVAPIFEMSLELIDAYCREKDWKIVGYYYGNERWNDLSMSIVGHKIADKIEAQASRACVLALSGPALSCESKSGLELLLKDVKRGWIPVDGRLELSDSVSEKRQFFSQALRENAHVEIYDFDDHFEDVKKDWRNVNVLKLMQLNL